MKQGLQQRRRICFVAMNYPPDLRGVARPAQRVVGFLHAGGYAVSVFAPWWDAPAGVHECRVETAAEGTIIWVPMSEDADLNSALEAAIEAEDRREPFALFHAFFLQMAYSCLGPSQAPGRRRPLLASIRGYDAIWMQQQATTKELLDHLTWITSVSTESLLRVDQYADFTDRSSFIPNSIDASLYAPWRRTAENEGVVGTVGIFQAKKALPALVQAYARLDRRWRRRLLVVGGIPQDAGGAEVRATVERLIQRYSLQDELQITGLLPQAQVGQLLLQMRVFACASVSEGLPNAMLEAAAAGVPIVATAIDGNRDVLLHRRSALLVGPADIRSLTGALQQVLSSEALADRLSAGAHALAKRLSPAKEKQAWLRLYTQLLSS